MNSWKASQELVQAFNQSLPLHLEKELGEIEFSFSDLMEWLTFAHHPEDSVYLIKNSKKTSLPHKFYESKLSGGNKILAKSQIDLTVQKLKDGSSLTIKNFESYHPKIYDVALKIGKALQSIPHANLYYTPVGQQTFDRHTDPHNIVIAQLSGIKKWKVDGLNEITLQPGDILFLPKNLAHEAVALEDSIHLSIGLYSLEVLDVLAQVKITKENLPLKSHHTLDIADIRKKVLSTIQSLSSISEKEIDHAIHETIIHRMKEEWIPSTLLQQKSQGNQYQINNRVFNFILCSEKTLTIYAEKFQIELEGDTHEIHSLLMSVSSSEDWKDYSEIFEHLKERNILCKI